jgi:hypothetical protein
MWQRPQKLNMFSPYSRILPLPSVPRGNAHTCAPKTMPKNVPVTSYTVAPAGNRRADKQTVVHLHSRVLLEDRRPRWESQAPPARARSMTSFT